MTESNSNLADIAERATRFGENVVKEMNMMLKEAGSTDFYRRWSKTKVEALKGLNRTRVADAIKELEVKGHVFGKKKHGSNIVFDLTLEDIHRIYEYRNVLTFRDKYKKCIVIFVANLKGGVAKTVSCVNIAHALRATPELIKENLRILVVDGDPQASSTMFLDHMSSFGDQPATAIQAMLDPELTTEIIQEHFIKPSKIKGVDVMPASIADAFLGAEFVANMKEYCPYVNPYKAMQENIIDKVKDLYDICLIDTGPHLDPIFANALVASDFILCPIPPSQVELDSTFKFLGRLDALVESIRDEGVTFEEPYCIGYMTKYAKKKEHVTARDFASSVFGPNLLEESIPRLDAFERVGEIYDTVISADPSLYPGDKKALKRATDAMESFTKCLFLRLEYILSQNIKIESK